MISEKAYGKINLGLDIIGTRPADGYHLVRMVMQTVNIFDTLELEEMPEGYGVKLFIKDSPEPLSATDNLINKAAEKLIESHHIHAGVKITLEKNIPIAAGMAGGSSDCAATIRGMNQLFSLNMSEEEMEKLGVTLGADVPYCIAGGTQLSEGIGEVLTVLPDVPDLTVIIAKPTISVSTKEAYGDFDSLAETIDHPDIDGMVKAVKNGDIAGISSRLGNVLEYVTAKKHEEINLLKNWMKEGGALNALMSGSGPTVFGLYDDPEKAWKAAEKISEENICSQLFVTGFINPSKE